jgi:CRISPR-associated protein Cas2
MVRHHDVEDDKRRRQVAKLLEAVGKRVNKSVFECFISEKQLLKLRSGIEKRVTRYDSVLYYNLCGACIEKIHRQGTSGVPIEIVKVF